MAQPLRDWIHGYTADAAEHAAATMRGDYERANELHDRIVSLFHNLVALGDVGLTALRSLLEAPDPSVRYWAATHMLRTEPAAASRVLENLVEEGGLIGLGAATVLEEWRNGTLKWP